MRVGQPGHELPAVAVAGGYVDVSDIVADYDAAFFGSGGLERLRDVMPERLERGPIHRLNGSRVGAPIARPHQILCIGLNYRDHAIETGQPIPTEPVVFNKAPNTLVGPNDPVRLPRGSSKVDWEVELGVVVGRRCEYLSDEEEARAAIAGYVVVNDVSERGFQLERGGQWVKGKSAATFNPCGPELVTEDEIPDVMGLRLWLDVDGVRRQSGGTDQMLFSPSFLVHYLSQFMVLEPGDLINTGTPAGVGMGHTPPVWLRAGQHMQLGIDGLGSQRQLVLEPSGLSHVLPEARAHSRSANPVLAEER